MEDKDTGTDMEDCSSSDVFFDVLDSFPSSEESEESPYSSVSSSHPKSPADAPLTSEDVMDAHLPSPSLRRRRNSSSSSRTSTRKIPQSDSKSSGRDSPFGSESTTPTMKREIEDSIVSGVTSDPIGTVVDQGSEIPTLPPENRSDTAVAADSGILIFVAGLVIKAIVFQINLLIGAILFPLRLLHFAFLLMTDPFGTMKSGRDHVIDKLLLAFGVLKDKLSPIVPELLERQQGFWKLALRLGIGCFWAFYVCFVLLGCLVTAFLVGRSLMQYVVEEPLQFTEELSFDYTKDSPVALVPITSCEGIGCGFDCEDIVKVGQNTRGRVIPPNHKLELTISLALPESDYNQNLGVFQVRAEFLSANGKVTAGKSRPCMLKFKSSPIRLLETFFRSAPLLAGYSSESQVISLKMKGFTETADPTACIQVLIEQRAEYRPGAGIPEIYAASLRLESELSLIKRIIWNWRRTLFIWISIGLFIYELLVILVCCRPLIIPRVRTQNTF